MNYHPNFKYCTLFVSGTELRTEKRTNRRTDDPITRWTFQAGGIKMVDAGVKFDQYNHTQKFCNIHRLMIHNLWPWTLILNRIHPLEMDECQGWWRCSQCKYIWCSKIYSPHLCIVTNHGLQTSINNIYMYWVHPQLLQIICIRFDKEMVCFNQTCSQTELGICSMWAGQRSKVLLRDHFVRSLSIYHALLLLTPHAFHGKLVWVLAYDLENQ